jgi:hypothetical protein
MIYGWCIFLAYYSVAGLLFASGNGELTVLGKLPYENLAIALTTTIAPAHLSTTGVKFQ